MKLSSGIIVTGLAATMLTTGAVLGTGFLSTAETTIGASAAATSPAAVMGTDPATDTPATTDSATTGSATTDSATTGSGTAAEATTEASTSEAGAATYDGAAVQTRYGAFQARVTVEDGVVTDIAWLQEGESDPHSQRINDTAVPALVEAILEAQSIDVGYISGASYTSQGVEDAVQSAFEQAGLA
ncbi:FMN-binding protein [Demequina sp. NBRC 110055]|uniref:FMN-binding protein n=1 Tax=Demequina sp. NBRC 110055 TaxID=1570344 RepID=UPI0013566C75|nr:FMN-binding protein [Demequina sp. NBRC 110055]